MEWELRFMAALFTNKGMEVAASLSLPAGQGD